jgi:ATP-dependent protease HslVU (ClpYQ) peptidase subunit
MASDGRVTEEDTVFSDSLQKIFRLKDGSLLGTSGDADDRTLVELFNKQKKFPSHRQFANLGLEFEAIHVSQNGEISIVASAKEKDKDYWTVSLFTFPDTFVAIGSGRAYAIGAMARGATAEQAVKVAIKYTTTCGGKIQKVKLIEQN